MKGRRRRIRRVLERIGNILVPRYSAAPELVSGRPALVHSPFSSRVARLSIALIVFALVILVPASWYWLSSEREQHRLDQLGIALAASDYSRAQDVLDELLSVSPGDEDYLWTSANVEEQLGGSEKANSIRTALAKRGYGPGVLWLVDRRFALQDVNTWSDAEHAEFDALYENSAKWAPEVLIELMKRRAAYWTVRGELQHAVDALVHICQYDPQASVHIAILFLRMGDRAQAETHANIARIALRSRVQRQPHDASARVQLARSLAIVSSESEALSCLAEGFKITRHPAMQQAAGEVLIGWAMRLKRVEGTDATFWPRLELIHRATQCAPQDAIVIDAVRDLIQECNESKTVKMGELREAAARGHLRVAAHSMLGWLHAFDSEYDLALQHLQLAMSDSPEVPTLLNNLSLALLNHSDDFLEQALTTIDLAIELLPGLPQFSETRGRVLMRMSHWEEAIFALNRALVAEELRPQIYEQLMRAHEKVGDAAAVLRYETLRQQSMGGGTPR